MRICILTHTFPRFDGDVAAPFMDGVALGLVENRNKVFVLAPFSPKFKSGIKRKYVLRTYKYVPFESWHKLGYSETLTDDKSLKFSGYLLSPLMIFFGIYNLYRLVKKEKIDIINAHWILPNGFIASVVSKLTGIPVVSTLPGSDVYMADRNTVFRSMAKFSAETSRAITSNSPQLLKDLAKISERMGSKKGSIQEKSYSIIYGVDPSKFFPTKKNQINIRKKLSIPPGSLVVTSVGRLVSKKGYKYLVKAAEIVLRKNKNIFFSIFGEGDQRVKLEKMIGKLGIKNKFLLPGWVKYNEMLYYQNLGDIFILPSIRDEEGNLDDQSVSVVEAMACGKPVVTTDFPGYKLVIEDSRNGFLVKEKRSDLMAGALLELIQSRSLREKMSKRSRELVLQRFSWKMIGKKYLKVFDVICNG